MRCARVAMIACAALSSGLCGCAPATTYTRRGPTAPAREPGCEFEIWSSQPPHDYVVLGVIDIAAFSVRRIPNTDFELRQVVAKDACRAGADAVLPAINGDGRYVLATAIKYLNASEKEQRGGAR